MKRLIILLSSLLLSSVTFAGIIRANDVLSTIPTQTNSPETTVAALADDSYAKPTDVKKMVKKTDEKKVIVKSSNEKKVIVKTTKDNKKLKKTDLKKKQVHHKIKKKEKHGSGKKSSS